MKRYYVSVGVLLFTAALAVSVWRGLAVAIARGWGAVYVYGLLAYLVLAAFIKLAAMYTFEPESRPGELLREWLIALAAWFRRDFLRWAKRACAIALVGACAVGVADVAVEARRRDAVVADFDAALYEAAANQRIECERMADELAGAKAKVVELQQAKAALDLEVNALSRENAKLTETIKKASGTGALPAGFVQPPR